MWKYVKPHLFFALPGGLFTVDEGMMDLLQPGIMSSKYYGLYMTQQAGFAT